MNTPSQLELGYSRHNASEFYTFLAALEEAMKTQSPGVAFDAARAAYEARFKQPCPFTVVRSCPSCRHFDRGHCHRWGSDVPAQAIDVGCDGHEYVMVNSNEESVPF